MQVGDNVAGRQARCPKCQTIVTVPGGAPAPAAAPPAAAPSEPPRPAPPVETLPSAEEEEVAVSATRSERPKKKPASPAARSRRYADDEDEDEPRPRRKPEKSSSLFPTLMLVGLGVIALSCLGCVGLGGWWVYDRAIPQGAEVEDAQQAVVPQANGGGGNPVDAGGGIPPANPPWNPPLPPPPEPPVKAVLANGKFEVEVPANPQPADPNNVQNNKRYQFDARADAVYRVQVGGSPDATAKVEGPAGPLPTQRDRFNNELRQDFAFQAAAAGTYIVTLELPRFNNNQATKLTIREMDGSEPLPDRLKLTPATVELPQIAKVQELNVYEKKFSGAAFAPDNKSFWIAHDDGVLSFWEHPSPLLRGSYTTQEGLIALGVDRKGRLYAQKAKERGPLAERTAADISVWENLRPEKEKLPLPAPNKTIALGGIIPRFINSNDGNWLYFLDVHNRKLGRIDPEKAAIDKEIDALTPGTKAFCLTPDGKTIYCCSDSNRIDIIDTKEFKRTKTVILDRGQPTSIAASNEGLVFLVGQKVEFDVATGCNTFMVDLTKGVPERANVLPVNQWIFCQHVEMLPDQRAVLFSGDRRVIACSLPSRPGLFRPVTKEQQIRDYFTQGQTFVSPDGRTVLYDAAVILSVSR
jgi:hypothetical protein